LVVKARSGQDGIKERESPLFISILTCAGRENQNTTYHCAFEYAKRYAAEVHVIKNTWNNVSKARNYGALLGLGKGHEIIAFMDDDLFFKPEDLRYLVSQASLGQVVWSTSTQIIYLKDFWRAGGFDERVFRVYQEDTEFLYRVQRMGMLVVFYLNRITHLGGKRSWKKHFLIKFNTPLVMLQHRRDKMIKEIFAWQGKHPLRWLSHFVELLGFIYHSLNLVFRSRVGREVESVCLCRDKIQKAGEIDDKSTLQRQRNQKAQARYNLADKLQNK